MNAAVEAKTGRQRAASHSSSGKQANPARAQELGERPEHRHLRAAHGVHNTRKFRQHTVASVLYGPAPMLLDLRINQLPEMRL